MHSAGHDCNDCGPRVESGAPWGRRKLEQKPVEWVSYKRGYGFEARRGSVYDVDFVHELVVGHRNGTFNVTSATIKWAWTLEFYNSTSRTITPTDAQIRAFLHRFFTKEHTELMMSGKEREWLKERRKLAVKSEARRLGSTDKYTAPATAGWEIATVPSGPTFTRYLWSPTLK